MLGDVAENVSVLVVNGDRRRLQADVLESARVGDREQAIGCRRQIYLIGCATGPLDRGIETTRIRTADVHVRQPSNWS